MNLEEINKTTPHGMVFNQSSLQYASMMFCQCVWPFLLSLNFVVWPLCVYLGWWMPMMLYALWYAWSYKWAFDGSLRGSPWLQGLLRPIFQHYANYFPITVKYTNLERLREQISSSKGVLLACFPHGFLPSSYICTMMYDQTKMRRDLPMIEFRGTSMNLGFRIPFVREWLMTFAVGGVGRESVKNLLKPQNHLIPATGIAPGGAREALYVSSEFMYMIVETRCGFTRIAKETGALLVPVMGFGENESFEQLQVSGLARKMQEAFQKHVGLTFPLLTSIFPRKQPLTIVYGEGIHVDEDDDVLIVHEKFKAALRKMHAEGDKWLGRPVAPLVFI